MAVRRRAPASRCFLCGAPIPAAEPRVLAAIRNRETLRDQDRRFHPPCFETFTARGGRPYRRPETEYEVLQSEHES